MSGKNIVGGFKVTVALATLFSAAVLGYMAGIRQTNPGTGGSQKTYQLKFGSHLDLRLTAGALGVAVIFVLTVMLAVAVLFAAIAYRRRRQVERTNRKLECEIAVRREAEDAVLESHERMRAIFDTALDGVITMDHEGRIVEFSPAAERIFGYRRSDVIGQLLADAIIPPALREQHCRGLEHYLGTGDAKVLGKRIEMEGLRADSSLVAVELSINQMPGAPPLFAGFVRDITERKQAEEMRSRLAAIVESSDDAVVGKTLQGIITSWNPGAERLFGYSAQEALGQPMLMLIPPESSTEESEILARIARGEGMPQFETVRVRKGGMKIDVSVTVSPIRDSQGKIVGASTIARDITERKLAEAKVKAQLERLNLLHQITRAIAGREDLNSIYQEVLRSLEDRLALDFACICEYDSDSQELTVVNVGINSQPLALELVLTEQARIPIDANGLSRCVGGQLVYEPDIAEIRLPFSQKLATAGLRSLVVSPLVVENKVFGVFIAARREHRSFTSGECEFLKQLSDHVALAAHHAQLYSALQQAYDDLRQTQQAVMQQERLRALGQMASGIAHDINNAISPVMIYTEHLLEQEQNLGSRSRGYLETIQRAIGDVAQTVSRMGEFYRQREPQLVLAPVDVNLLAQQVADLTRARWNDMPQKRGIAIGIRMELAPDLPAVMGVESEIREALINLIFNGVDAMPGGGVLTLRTSSAELKPSSPELGTLRNVDVEVGDTGVGMDEETRNRCAEPFFTTKGERGTGLGLAMVYGIVQRHGGDIAIESSVGRGTIVRLRFPGSAQVAPQGQFEIARPVPSRLRILVVDDDPVLLKSLCDTLACDGHVVVTASGGQEGVDAFRKAQKSSQPFDVVFTDLGMPYFDGRRVASTLKHESPSTPVILLTGWGQRFVAEGEVSPHVDRVLSKPPKLSELREALAISLTASKGRKSA